MAFGPKSKKRRAFVARQLTVIAQREGFDSTQEMADLATEELNDPSETEREAVAFGIFATIKTEPCRRAFFQLTGEF